MEERQTIIDASHADGPRLNLLLPWSALLTSIAGIVYITYRAAAFEAAVISLEKTMHRIEANTVQRAELDLLRERDSQQREDINDLRRQVREFQERTNGRPR